MGYFFKSDLDVLQIEMICLAVLFAKARKYTIAVDCFEECFRLDFSL